MRPSANERKSKSDCIRTRTTSCRRKRRQREQTIPHLEPKRHHQRLETFHGSLPQTTSDCRMEPEITHLEPHLIFHPETHLLLHPGSIFIVWLGSHRMYRITRPPVRFPIQVSKKRSTARKPREHRGQTPRPRVWILHTPIETDFGSRSKTG